MSISVYIQEKRKQLYEKLYGMDKSVRLARN